MNNTPKVVITNSLTESPWDNAVVAGGDLAGPSTSSRPRTAATSSPMAAARSSRDLIAKGLLDELHLFVNPTAIGTGMPVFPNLETNQQFHLVSAQPFDCGITALHLEPNHS